MAKAFNIRKVPNRAEASCGKKPGKLQRFQMKTAKKLMTKSPRLTVAMSRLGLGSQDIGS